MKQLLAENLKSESDIVSFIDTGGLKVICDNINCHATVLRWSVHDVSDSSISHALSPRDTKDSTKDKSKVDIDGTELKNLAPCGKITGPPNSPPAEILLQTKPMHRRSRFAAWSYQFNDDKEDWITITIELPFAVLLKQVIIYAHQSFLGNCPSELFIELKDCGGAFTPHTPAIPSGGLSVIPIHFARGVTTKALKIHMRKPAGSDVIKLNIIELYGKAAICSQVAHTQQGFAKRFYWIELLDKILSKCASAALELKQQSKLKLLIKSLSTFMNFAFSENSVKLEILSSMIVKIVSQNAEELRFLLEDLIFSNGGRRPGHFDSHPFLHHRVSCLLLSDVFDALGVEERASSFRIILSWTEMFVKSFDNSSLEEKHCLPFPSLCCIARILECHSELRNAVDKATFQGLNSSLLQLLKNTDAQTFKEMAILLSCTSVIDKFFLENLVGSCTSALESKDDSIAIEKNLFSIISILTRCVENCEYIIETTLPVKTSEKIQYILEHVYDGDQNSFRRKLSSLIVLTDYLLCSSENPNFRAWIGYPQNCTFLKPLIIFLCSAYLDKCLLPVNLDDRGLLLSDIHALQSLTVKFIRNLVSCNLSNQKVFVEIIKDILFKENLSGLSINNNSFMKRLVLQLILDEQEIAAVVMKPDLTSSKELTTAYQNACFHRDVRRNVIKRLRLSDPLSVLFESSKNDRLLTKTEQQPAAAAAASDQSGSSCLLADNWVDEGDWAEAGDVSMIVASAKCAAEKRLNKVSTSADECQDICEVKYDIQLFNPLISKCALPPELTAGQILHLLAANQHECLDSSFALLADITSITSDGIKKETDKCLLSSPSYPSLLHTFAADGGIELLAKYNKTSLTGEFGKSIEASVGLILKFVTLNGFSDMFLKESKKAEYLLRLMLGVEETSEGDLISNSPVATELPVLPFVSLRELFMSAPLDSVYGRELREDAFSKDIIALLLTHLGKLCSQEPAMGETRKKKKKSQKPDAGPSYWAKGTGFGTGSTASTWDVQKVMEAKRKEEDHVVCILQVLAKYIDPSKHRSDDELRYSANTLLPHGLSKCLQESPLQSVLSNYLRNDSVLDMARHIPLFHALMEMLRALVACSALIPLLLPTVISTGASAGPSGSISQLLARLRTCADTYINRLKGSKKRKTTEPKKGLKGQVKETSTQTEEAAEGPSEMATEALNVLIKDIQETSNLVETRINSYKEQLLRESNQHDVDEKDRLSSSCDEQKSLEDKYLNEMKDYQFDTFEFVADDDDGNIAFHSPFHYADTIRTAVASGDFSYSYRARRLAQEIASLTTSLPLSFSSSVFIRCDENRLDLMKVLITGPEDTPYANGCFEFDIYFPHDYPTSPMMVNLQTTGQHSIRFNPNLYNDGKVCLSILNTWHGRPEEKWNPQTSNLLQVLVSIQSLIFVPDPYFNEPGYERSRGTPIGQQNSIDYNANIKQASIKWAMLEQIKNPSPCFTKIIQRHFTLKRTEILNQCEGWISKLKEHSSRKKSTNVHYEAMKRHSSALQLELDKLIKDHSPQHVDNTRSLADGLNETSHVEYV